MWLNLTPATPTQSNSSVFKPLRIAIVGAGAVGCYYGARLAKAGHQVHFLLRGDLAHVRRHGLEVRSHHGDFSLPAEEMHVAGKAEEIGPVDLVLVALKTTANHALTSLLPPLLQPDTLVVTLQNGLGNEEALAALHRPEQVLGGVCFTCINRLSPGVIEHSAQGQIVLGEFAQSGMERLESLAATLRQAEIDCVATPSLMGTRWRKLIWNTTFNGMCVTAGMVDCSVIVGTESLRQAAVAQMREFCQVTAAFGFPQPADYPEKQIRVTEAVGAYQPSTLIDFAHGREPEIESIWGEPLRRAEALGLVCPLLRQMYQELKAKLAT
jgi:2-dehydropantoate 2-reductase